MRRSGWWIFIFIPQNNNDLHHSISDSSYTLVSKIGDGGFSSIYHVYDKSRQSFAVKIVNLLKIDGYTDKDLKNEIDLLTVIP